MGLVSAAEVESCWFFRQYMLITVSLTHARLSRGSDYNRWHFMNFLPFAFEPIAATTWGYLASLLMLALFFKFNRCWSVRNLDLFLIILLAPGLLMVDAGRQMEVRSVLMQQSEPAMESNDLANVPVQTVSFTRWQTEAGEPVSGIDPDDDDALDRQAALEDNQFQSDLLIQNVAYAKRLQLYGYIWLFSIGSFFLTRLLIDPLLVRRPMLEPNLSIGGLVFLACSLMAFLVANILTSSPTADDLQGVQNSLKMIQREAAGQSDIEQLQKRGPGYWMFNLFPAIQSFGQAAFEHQTLETAGTGRMPSMSSEVEGSEQAPPALSELQPYVIAARSLAIISQIFIVLGLILFCHYHYDNFTVGVGLATIHLMLPYTALYHGHVLHSLPAALVLWALVSFRSPFWAGVLIGLATSVSYYPFFLLPLWCSYYWDRGVRRFALGVAVSLVVGVAGFIFTSVDVSDFFFQVKHMFGVFQPLRDDLEGVWALGWNKWNRLPLLIGSVMLAVSFIWWPRQKDIGVLISYSAAIMVSVQFWNGFGGGLYVAWYVPLALLVFFRPNVEGRIAVNELAERVRKRKTTPDEVMPVA